MEKRILKECTYLLIKKLNNSEATQVLNLALTELPAKEPILDSNHTINKA